MNVWQALGVAVVTVLVAFCLYVAWTVAQYQVKKRWPDTVEVKPVALQQVPESPSSAWWDELQALRTQFMDLQGAVRAELTEAQNEKRLARNAEERTRKMRSIDDELDETLAAPPRTGLVEQPGGWEEEAPAPVGRQPASVYKTILDQRRLRGA